MRNQVNTGRFLQRFFKHLFSLIMGVTETEHMAKTLKGEFITFYAAVQSVLMLNVIN